MEIADIFVVNKADRPSSERLVSDLKQTLATKKKQPRHWPIPVIPTVATERKNTDQLFARINAHIEFIKGNGQFDEHRRLQIKKKILNILKNRFQREFLDRLAGEADLDALADSIHRGEANPFAVGNDLFDRFSR
jgi:LAO/AO transport system kinase